MMETTEKIEPKTIALSEAQQKDIANFVAATRLYGNFPKENYPFIAGLANKVLSHLGITE